MGLIQSVIEQTGIATTSITLLREITGKVGPPRALFVDRPLGYPLGEPHAASLQREIVQEALALLEQTSPEPRIEIFRPKG